MMRNIYATKQSYALLALVLVPLILSAVPRASAATWEPTMLTGKSSHSLVLLGLPADFPFDELTKDIIDCYYDTTKIEVIGVLVKKDGVYLQLSVKDMKTVTSANYAYVSATLSTGDLYAVLPNPGLRW